MQTRRRRKQAALSILQLPDSYLHNLIIHLTSDSKLAFRATCKTLLHAVDGTGPVSTPPASASSQLCEPCSSASKVLEAQPGLRLLLTSRRPSISMLHGLHLLHNVVVLNTQTAGRGAISIGCTDVAQQLAGSLPGLRSAIINNSQASLVDMLVHAAPRLSSLQLSVTSSTPKVMSQLSCFTALTSLELQLMHPAWLKGCAGLGELAQLQRLMIVGKPLCEASKHGEGAVSGTFWEANIKCLTGLTSLHVNPWVKSETGCVTYSTLTSLRQLHVPYSSGKCGLGATSAMLSHLQSCSHLTSLCFGAHEFNWEVSHLSCLTQLRELEIHNPFLKEVWGLQPFTAAALTPLTAATALTSLTLSHLRLPLLTDTMATAGQAVAAVAAQPGAAAALADALASGDGPAADIVHAIAAAAVATALRGAAAAATDKSQPDRTKAVWIAVADTLQQQAAAAVAAATAQLPAAYGSRTAAAGLQALHLPAAAVAAAAAEGNLHLSGAVSGGPSAAAAAAVAPEMLALAHEVIAAMAKHTAVRLQQQREQCQPQQQQQHREPGSQVVCDESLKQRYLRAAHALAASVGPVVAAAAAAGAALPGGQLPAYLAVPPAPGQALAAAHLAAQVAGGNPLAAGAAAAAAAAALAGPPLGFVAVPAVPPPLLPPPPPPVVAPQPPPPAAAVGAPMPAVGIPAAVPAAGLAAVSAAAAEAAAAAATSAANASASMLLEQVPVLASLKRLTVGTTHGRLLSGVQLAALAPSLTCFEDLSEIPRVPSMTPDVLGGLDQLSLLTVNVDTLQLYARHASLTGLRGLSTISSTGCGGADVTNVGQGSDVSTGVGHAADRQPVAATAAVVEPEPDKAVGKASKKAAAGSTKATGKKKQNPRGSRTTAIKGEVVATATAADGGSLNTLSVANSTTTSTAAAADGLVAPTASSDQDVQQQSAAVLTESEPAAAMNATPASQDSKISHTSSSSSSNGSSSSVTPCQPGLLHLGSSWRQLSNLRCLRLLMLGHLCSGALSEVRLLPTLPGVTRLELCSAFAGSLAYAETYTIEEDPHLWQEQVGVEELVVDGGVLLGGFMVDVGMADLLKQKLRRLRRLVLCRCLDLTVEHVQTAMQRRLAPVIVVKRDCPGVTEADVVRLNQQFGGAAVAVEYEAVKPNEYEGKAFTYAIDE